MEPAASPPFSSGSEPGSFAPSPFDRSQKSSLPVLIGGLVTGVLALTVVWLIAGASEFNLMGWYFWFILPAGAIIVGAVAGSGYGIASRVTGTKISKGLLWSVVGLQVACYFGAQVVEYRQVVTELGLEDVSFFAYFDFSTRMFAFIGDDGELGTSMGAWGYAFRILEIGGFVAGGLIAPLLMRAAPFCDTCQVYMKRKHLGLLPAGIVPRKVKKKDVEGQEALGAEAEAAWTAGIENVATLCAAAESGQPDIFHDALAQFAGEQKAIDKLTARIRIVTEICPSCFQGNLVSEALIGQGENLKTEVLSTTPLQPEFSRGLMDPGRRAA